MVRSSRTRPTLGSIAAQLSISAAVLLLPPIALGAAVYVMMPAHDDAGARSAAPAAAVASVEAPSAPTVTVIQAQSFALASAAHAPAAKEEARAPTGARRITVTKNDVAPSAPQTPVAKDEARPPPSTVEIPVAKDETRVPITVAAAAAKPIVAKDRRPLGSVPVHVTVVTPPPNADRSPASHAATPASPAAGPLVIEAPEAAAPATSAATTTAVAPPGPATFAEADPTGSIARPAESPAPTGDEQQALLAPDAPIEPHAAPARRYHFPYLRRLANRNYWRHDPHTPRAAPKSRNPSWLHSLFEQLSDPSRSPRRS